MKTLRIFSVALLAALLLVAQPYAQTALNSTTLSAAVTATATTVSVASASTIVAGHRLFVDKELMTVSSVSGTSLRVLRGQAGTAASAHASAALVYTGAPERFGSATSPTGSCTRASERYLPRIVPAAGEVWDCPTGAQVWTLLNSSTTLTARSEAFNLDNGAGTTIDAVLIRPARSIYITACRVIYEDATTGTVAAGNARVGTTVGGSEVVASTAYENTKAVGTTTAMVIVAGAISAGTPVLVRHTGVAVTQAGEAVVECDYHYR